MIANIANWRWYQVAEAWIGSAILLIVLVLLQLNFVKPSRWFLPHPATFRGFFAFLAAIWRRSPLLAVEVIGIPALMFGLTIYWVAAMARS